MIATLVLSTLGFQELMNHEFVFKADKVYKQVNLAGSFNNWSATETPMMRGIDDKTWVKQMKLPYGKHQYKFVADGNWTVDPFAKKNEDDGNGNTNSVLMILPPDFDHAAAKGDALVTTSAILHQNAQPYVNIFGNTAEFKIRARANDLETIKLVANGKSYAPISRTSDEFYETFGFRMAWDRKAKLNYAFTLVDGDLVYKLAGGKLDPKTVKTFEVPAWVSRSIIYQIFPDRFENGSRSNDPKIVTPWNGVPTFGNRMGGDFAGIGKRANYLKALGVGAIYLNPIFASPSNHRYEADDFQKADKELGTNQEFFALSKSLKGQGIRTILDFAYNHSSPGTVQFKDLIAKGENSKFKTWYFPKSYPIKVGENPNYEAWYGFPSMPKLNVMNPEVSNFLIETSKFWIKNAGIDGMRLDVANEVDMRFWRKMRPIVKAANPNLWIVGEIWGDGNPWLKGDQFDSVMNYQFREAILRFVAAGSEDAHQFKDRLLRVHNSYPTQVSKNMMNLLGSHDTPRILNECGGDREKAKIAATIQFTWIGQPSVYYGDELGMSGGRDPENRKGMQWELATQDNDMLRHYKTLAKTRNKFGVYADGDVKAFEVSENGRAGAFVRANGTSASITAFNLSDQEQTVSLSQGVPSGKYFDIFSGASTNAGRPEIHIKLKPKSSTVLVMANSNSSLAKSRAKTNSRSTNN